MKNKCCWIVALSSFLVAATVLAGFVICPRCGYENEDSRSDCSHCRGNLPESARPVEPPPSQGDDTPSPRKPPPSETSVDEDETNGAVVSQEIVAEELQIGKEYIRAGDLDLARLFLRNAGALDMLRAQSSGAELSKTITALVTRCEEIGSRVKRRCPECDGTGRQSLGIRRLRGDEDTLLSESKCDRCQGRGFFMDAGHASERKFRAARAVNKYTRLQQGRKFVPIGGAWVPLAVEPKLTIRQTVQLRRATALPCEECMGVGRLDCDECKGAGFEKCSNRDCKNGMIEVEKGGQLSKTTAIKLRERCPDCRGKGKQACRECLGRGSVVCDECGGTGQRELCSRCGGQGMAPCRRCRGVGSYRGGQCTTCGGSGSALCSSCSGDGRKK